MPLSDLLEDFTESGGNTGAVLSDVKVEELKLEAFERGYQAGWDDSAKAQQDSSTHLSEDFARNIRDLSFTYDEAYAGLVAAMRPLIGQTVNVVLPELAHATLGMRVAALIEKEIAACGPQPVILTTAPASAAALQAVLPQDAGFPIAIRQDDTLAEGQVQLRIGDATEREIDLQGVLDGIRDATDSFFQETAPTAKETA
ncbi:ABC transporter ATP-binding protein [Roseovarius amoyensis]|uniref:ABC transporter ATP-binding protein n=1 Tax=Roseovarius amoyensis TaxID=2211448 RepID=UPI0013A6DE2D|nr:ABC transporter ATP-binding protein [Roseovarius amoyensis]